MSLDTDVVLEIAIELGVDPAFIEKDWYSVQVLSLIAEFSSPAVTTIFSGGTSLAKGFGVLQRFSEDLDFRCRYEVGVSGNQLRKIRSEYRGQLVEQIKNCGFFSLNEPDIAKASHYIKFPLSYEEKQFEHASLRPGLQVEFSFTQPRLDPEVREIQSFVSQFTEGPAETKILCLSPVETASDKLSALTWRVLKRDRSDKNDDPAMIRHLHDLCALKTVVHEHKNIFLQTASSSFDEDQRTGKRDTEKSFFESMTSAIALLHKDKEYQREYAHFVEAMSYADDEEIIDFYEAKENLEELASFFE